MKLILRQKIWLTIVLAANLALWIIPSDIVEQIARDRHTMLGRYSRTHFTWIVAIALISIMSFYIDWSQGATYKRRWFRVTAAVIGLTPMLIIADFFLRSEERAHYIQDTLAYHHPPGGSYRRVSTDQPQAHRTYPDPPAGFDAVDCTLQIDRRGFRNQTDLDEYDIVVLGDSFAAGSNVSDEHPWPVRLAALSGLSVYNLGMSGYAPIHYLASLKEYALALRPRIVLCMIYEGNDFRSAKSDRKQKRPGFSKRLKRYVKQSPIINTVDQFFIDSFGPMRSTRPVPGIEMLDWLPLSIPESEPARFYAFEPKQLRDLYQSPEDFALDKHWLNPRAQLREMNTLCKQAGCKFILVFAPTKAHVTIPLVADRLPAGKVRSFTAISYKKKLPPPDAFLSNLLARVDAKETVIQEWCRREGIPFIGVTGALRKGALAGRQVYYTYDQHWTPPGHEVVAQAVYDKLAGQLLETEAIASKNLFRK